MTPKITSVASQPGQLQRHGARVLDSLRHDPYEPRGKYPPTRCGGCGAVYRAGRWRWMPDGNEKPGICPACRRIADHMPAGRLTLHGPYVAAHRSELLRLALHEADAERAEHPMHRTMDTDVGPDTIQITTTDVHSARRIGEALRRAHDGDLSILFSEAAYEIRVVWRR